LPDGRVVTKQGEIIAADEAIAAGLVDPANIPGVVAKAADPTALTKPPEDNWDGPVDAAGKSGVASILKYYRGMMTVMT